MDVMEAREELEEAQTEEEVERVKGFNAGQSWFKRVMRPVLMMAQNISKRRCMGSQRRLGRNRQISYVQRRWL